LIPTITPTPNAAQVCEQFSLFSAPQKGARVPYDGRIAFSWTGAPADAEVRLAIWHRQTNQGILVQWPSNQSLNMPVEMLYLDDTGIYDWQLSLYYEALGDLCAVEGWFTRLRPTIPTPSSPETSTAEATAPD